MSFLKYIFIILILLMLFVFSSLIKAIFLSTFILDSVELVSTKEEAFYNRTEINIIHNGFEIVVHDDFNNVISLDGIHSEFLSKEYVDGSRIYTYLSNDGLTVKTEWDYTYISKETLRLKNGEDAPIVYKISLYVSKRGFFKINRPWKEKYAIN